MQNIVINHWAVITAAVASFLIGGIWYSPLLFENAWLRENGFTREDMKSKGGTARIMGGSFVLQLIMAYNLGAFLSGPADIT
jgi:uncharacterized protein DUF1761